MGRKTTVWIFQTENNRFCIRQDLHMAMKRNLKRETESLQIAVQNSVKRTNYIKVKIFNTQRHRKCRLYGGKNETIKHIISKYSKLAQKEYKTIHEWVGKVIQWD